MKKNTKMNFRYMMLMGLLLWAGDSAYAQQQETSSETRYTPKFGIKGGVNFSNLYISKVQNENVKIGVNAGIFVKVPIVRGISIQHEILYSNKGSQDTYNNIAQGSGQYRYNLNYIESPMLLVFNLTRHFNLNAGGYAAYLVSANVKDMKSDGTIAGIQNLNADNFNRIDFGLVGGLGIDIQRVTLGARYNYGLRNVGKSGTLASGLTTDSKNSVATVFIGFAF